MKNINKIPQAKHYDYLVIGAGIMGLTIAYELRIKHPEKTIAILEKEADVALHASGRNSGVLHAGFYYSSDSLKARFTVSGNKLMKAFCHKHGIPVNACKKVVVASGKEEVEVLYELEQRGKKNGVDVMLIDEEELQTIEPNAKTYEKALYSPSTATVNPVEVCQKLKELLLKHSVDFYFNTKYKKRKRNTVTAGRQKFQAGFIINAAGLYADVIAKDFGFSKDFTILPFKGLYLKYNGDDMPISTNIYPVPNAINPFLGVHYTLTANNHIKIGPTSTPAFWRENYNGFQNFNAKECLQILYYELRLFFTNSFHFRTLTLSELKKYNKKHFIRLAQKLTKTSRPEGFNQWLPPGIRAQLLHKKTLELITDFVIEGNCKSLHLLNAVSPAFTCSFALAKFIVN
ncbi:MAG: L-2-hydroxyglutarate oxidase, partial [Bacteroidota bacterium]